jgi:dipeptidase
VENDGPDNVHGPDYLPSRLETSIYNWTAPTPIFHIPQVSHTYSYTLGTYAIQNEKQVSIGESTCSAVFFAKPIYAEGGGAAMHMETLTELALERCDTARCAVQTMGDLAVKYGFYGAGWSDSVQTAEDEAGEALTVADPNETWLVIYD